METKDLQQANRIMKWVLGICAVVYALLILAIYTLLGDTLSANVKLIITYVSPMVLGGVALLILKKLKRSE